MYTVTCEYFATGEGQTYMVLFTQGYGNGTVSRDNALDNFKEAFGDYYAIGAEVQDGIHFDFPSAKYLLSDALKQNILEWEKEAGGLEYRASLHVNFS